MQSQLIDSKQHSRFCKTDLVTLPSLKISIPQLCLPENSCITEWSCNSFPCNIEEMCQVCTKKEHGVLSVLFPCECTYPKGNCQLVQCSARPIFCVQNEFNGFPCLPALTPVKTALDTLGPTLPLCCALVNGFGGEVGQHCRHSGLMIRVTHRSTLAVLFLLLSQCGLGPHLVNQRNGFVPWNGVLKIDSSSSS